MSYADFITLLFAFFVVMFASSHADRGKAEQVSESIRRALSQDQIASAIAGILGGTTGKKGSGNAQFKGPGGVERSSGSRKEAQLGDLALSLAVLRTQLRQEIEGGMLQVNLEARGLVISLRQASFFPSGQDAIAPSTYAALDKLVGTVQQLPNKVRLEGHTDTVPIRGGRFRSNWDLSLGRGLAMLELLRDRYRVAEERMSVAGYGETVPIDSNQTPEGRAHNRRVDIVILNEMGVKGEPKAVSGALQ
ncbi:MAG: OmpA family protein [Candidatus Solibacter usitatus]|nr:OmpA family protein [Candidatus Solibacter usitatus]